MSEPDRTADKAAEGASGVGGDARGLSQRSGSKPSVRPFAAEATDSTTMGGETVAIDPEAVVETKRGDDLAATPRVEFPLELRLDGQPKSVPPVPELATSAGETPLAR